MACVVPKDENFLVNRRRLRNLERELAHVDIHVVVARVLHQDDLFSAERQAAQPVEDQVSIGDDLFQVLILAAPLHRPQLVVLAADDDDG